MRRWEFGPIEDQLNIIRSRKLQSLKLDFEIFGKSVKGVGSKERSCRRSNEAGVTFGNKYLQDPDRK